MGRTDNRWFRTLVASALLATALACASDDDEDRLSAEPVRDSAGVTVVESVLPAWAEGEGWRADFEPILDLAADRGGPEYEFFGATDADRLSDGSIVVADDGSDEVRVFSPVGEHVRTLGGNGEGPGEFNRLDQLQILPGDSILAYDFWAARITIFAPDGTLGRIVTLDGSARLRPLFQLTGATGYVGMATDFTGFGDDVGLRRWSHPIVQVDSAGVVIDTLTTIQGNESVVFEMGDAAALWGKRGRMEARGGAVYLGSSDSVSFEVFGPRGQRRIARVPGYDLALTQADIDGELSTWFPDSVPPDPFSRAIQDAQPERTHRPGYQDLVVDATGSVWLEAFRGLHEASEPANWEVFDPSGEWLGSVTLPPGFKVFRIGTDWILGKNRDELDVEHIQLLALTR